MDTTQIEHPHRKHWQHANVRLLPSFIIATIGYIMCDRNGHITTGSWDNKFVAIIGLMLFLIFVVAFTQVLTKTVCRIISAHGFTPGRVAAIQFVLRLLGYVTIFLIVLDLLGIPIGKLLLGGAALGIILGVAAQQALANFFASVVIIISHPFSVGDHVTIKSGALGGPYSGQIKDIGLTHTRIQENDGVSALLPNATLLSGAAIVSGHIAKPAKD
jgi:small-conductance mechanosensitive channel